MPVYDPSRYNELPVSELLGAAARGYIGVDRRLLRSILNRSSAATEVLAFTRESDKEHRIDLDPLLVDLFRHWGTPEALEYYMAVVRRHADDLSDDLILALLPLREQAVGPLLALYNDLEEEESSDVAFLLAGLQMRDPRILAVLLDRLEFDAADGAFLLGLYGDIEAKPRLEAVLAEIEADDVELRREVQYALEQLGREMETYQAEPFDLLREYPEREGPAFDVLNDAERLEMLGSPDADVRAQAAHSFFNQELDPKTREALLLLARSDADAKVRGEAWASLADATEDASLRDEMLAVLKDPARDVLERGGAAVGLYGVADRDDVRPAIEKLYEEGGLARAKALEAMWRSLWPHYSKFFAGHLEDSDIAIVRQALRGAGYFQLTQHVDKIAAYFDRDDDKEDLREDALFAYAMAMPGQTTRGRVRGMLRKIDSIAQLRPEEGDLVMFALDERLRLHGLEPVFQDDAEDEVEEATVAPAAPTPTAKAGRNDPCPCGSGKKFKKCHGA